MKPFTYFNEFRMLRCSGDMFGTPHTHQLRLQLRIKLTYAVCGYFLRNTLNSNLVMNKGIDNCIHIDVENWNSYKPAQESFDHGKEIYMSVQIRHGDQICMFMCKALIENCKLLN